MEESYPEENLETKPEAQKPEFKSAFKKWVRVVALLVAVIFIPEQISWAINYNPAVFWHNLEFTAQPLNNLGGLTPPQITNELLAENLKRSLQPLLNKPLTQINFGRGVLLDLGQTPVRLSKDKLERAYQWLRKNDTQAIHCGIYVLYNLLRAYHKAVSLEHLANTVFLIDLLSATIDEDIEKAQPLVKSSLFALAKAAEYFGLKLYPAKVASLSEIEPPFIAHLDNHFVLITKVTEERVEFFYDKGDTFLPLKQFQKDFSGYVLSAQAPLVGSAVNQNEAKQIKGATAYFKKSPIVNWSIEDALLSTAIMLVSAYLTAGTGTYLQSLATTVMTSQISQATTSYAVYQGMNPQTAQILGMVVGSGVAMGYNSAINASGYNANVAKINNKSLSTVSVAGAFFKGFGYGVVQGTVQAGVTIAVQEALKKANMSDSVKNGLAGVVGSWIGGYTGAHLAQSMGLTPILANGAKFEIGEFGKVWTKPALYQLAGVAVEWAADEFIWKDKKDRRAGYSRILGQSVGAIFGAIGNYSSYQQDGGKLSKTGLAFQTLGKGLLNGLISVGLESWAGEFKDKDKDGIERNRWGLTRLEMATVNWLTSALLYSTAQSIFRGVNFGDSFGGNFKKFSEDLLSFGGTIPGTRAYEDAIKRGATPAYLASQFNVKMWEFSGLMNVAAAARMYREMGKKDKRDWNLLGSPMASLINYTASTLHYAAVDTLMNIVPHIVRHEGFAKNPLVKGIAGIEFGKFIEGNETYTGKLEETTYTLSVLKGRGLLSYESGNSFPVVDQSDVKSEFKNGNSSGTVQQILNKDKQ